MKIQMTLQTIAIDHALKYDILQYPSSGLFIVNDNEIYFANKDSGFVNGCVFFQDFHLISELIYEKNETKDIERTVSESFALKAMAIASKQCKTLTLDNLFD